MATFLWPLLPVNIPGVATEATLLQVEQNTADTVTELQTLNATDFATETTLATLATEATVSTLATEATVSTLATEASLLNLIATDFATETTLLLVDAKLATVETEIQALNTNIQLNIQAPVATETTVNAIRTATEGLYDKTGASLFTQPYDTVEVTSTSIDGPTQIVTKVGGLGGATVQTLNIVYDGNGDFESAVVS